MKRLHRCCLVAPLLVAAGLLAPVTAAAAKVPAEKLLPPRTYGFINVPSVPEFKERFEESSFGHLVRDPALAEFKKEVETQLEKASAALRGKLGVSLDEILSLPTGEVAVAWVHPTGKQPGLVLLVEFGGPGGGRKTIDKLLEVAKDALEKNGFKEDSTRVKGTPVTVFTPPEKASGPDWHAAWMIKDSYFVAATQTGVLESVLERWDGRHDSTFADNESYSLIMDRCSTGRRPVLRWYINPIELVRSVVNYAAAEEAGPQFAMVMGFLPALGVDKLKALGGTFDVSTGEYDMVSRTLVHVDLPATGLLNVFHFPPIAHQPPRWVPADVASWVGMNWDVAKAYEAIEGIVDTFQGPGALERLMEQAAKSEPGIHPKKDVIDNLTGRIQFVARATRIATPTGELPTAMPVIALGIKDSAKIEKVLAKIAETEGFPGRQEDFEGHTLYLLDLPLPGMAFGAAVAREHLFIAMDVNLLKDLIRKDSKAKPLADSKDYKQIAGKFPAKTSIAGFGRSEESFQMLFELLKSGAAEVPGVDLSKLPEFEKLKKYFHATGSYAIPDKNGVYFESFTLSGNP